MTNKNGLLDENSNYKPIDNKYKQIYKRLTFEDVQRHMEDYNKVIIAESKLQEEQIKFNILSYILEKKAAKKYQGVDDDCNQSIGYED